MRHLHDRMHVLETRTAPPKEEDTSAADAAAAAMGYGGMGLMGLGGDTLMITNAPAGYGTLRKIYCVFPGVTSQCVILLLMYFFLPMSFVLQVVTARTLAMALPASPILTVSPPLATATAALLQVTVVEDTIKCSHPLPTC